MSDRLALSNAIEDAGIERAKAERLATVIVDTIHGGVATKADLVELKGTIAVVDAKLTVAMIFGGLLFAALLASQAVLWIGQGKIDGQLAAISAQMSEVARAVGARPP